MDSAAAATGLLSLSDVGVRLNHNLRLGGLTVHSGLRIWTGLAAVEATALVLRLLGILEWTGLGVRWCGLVVTIPRPLKRRIIHGLCLVT